LRGREVGLDDELERSVAVLEGARELRGGFGGSALIREVRGMRKERLRGRVRADEHFVLHVEAELDVLAGS
nr:hypothetical protein [Tanacetum cinerariifolium]